MNRAAWWTCALLVLEFTLSHARIYERCELARDLRALGVHLDHISTWVCIAYHESRFDTAANNPHSGDHGLFQISELYWCGAGKACGLPCSALRDDDIADDLECALQVHEEHTRLQGDGFLAWVVYPQYCKHSTKKYLIDCDEDIKNTPVLSQGRSYNTLTSYDNRYKAKPGRPSYNNPNIDDLLPPYLTISSIFRGSYGKVLDHNKINGVNWYNYKYDDVDQLKLPNFVQGIGKSQESTTVTTTTTTYVPPVKPWRFIETNQFRKKAFVEKTTPKSTTYQDYSAFQKYTTGNSTTNKPLTKSTTHKSITTVTKTTISSYKSPSAVISTVKPVNITNNAYTFPTFRPLDTNKFTTSSNYNYRASTTASTALANPSTKPPFAAFTFSPTTRKPANTSTAAFTFPTNSYTYRVPNFSITTIKPSTTKPTTIFKTPPVSTTRPATPWYTFTSRLRTFGSTTNSSPQYSQTTTTTPRYHQTTKSFFTSLTQRPPSTSKPLFFSTTSASPRQLYPLSNTKIFTSTQRPFTQTSTTTKSTTKKTPRTTQNIFDLYLNPTKPPNLPSFSFSPRENSKFNLNIFSGGTTTIRSSNKNFAEG